MNADTLLIQQNPALDNARHKVTADAAAEVWAPRGWETIGVAAPGLSPDDFRTVEEFDKQSKARAKALAPIDAPDVSGETEKTLAVRRAPNKSKED